MPYLYEDDAQIHKILSLTACGHTKTLTSAGVELTVPDKPVAMPCGNVWRGCNELVLMPLWFWFILAALATRLEFVLSGTAGGRPWKADTGRAAKIDHVGRLWKFNQVNNVLT